MPSIQSVHVDRLLTEIVYAVKQDRAEFIADQAFPPLPAEKEHDLFGKYDKSTFMRRPSLKGLGRQAGAKYLRADYKVTSDSFKCEEFGIEHALDDRTKRLADAAFAVSQVPLEMNAYHVLRERELRVQALCQSTATITQNTTLAGASKFDQLGSDPIGVIQTGAQTILTATGMLPNLAIIPWQVWMVVKNHAELIERIKYKENYPTTLDVKGFFDVFTGMFAPDARLLIPKAVYDASAEGQAFSSAFLWGKHITLAYSEQNPVREKPTFGYTFENEPLAALTYRDESITSDISRVRQIVAEKVVDASCAYLIANAVN